MNEAPERIWAVSVDGTYGSTRWSGKPWNGGVKYIRADLARPKVKPLEWDDFEGMGANASAFLLVGYLITFWHSMGVFEISVTAPGYSTIVDGERFHPTLEEDKAAAQEDYERRILDALY